MKTASKIIAYQKSITRILRAGDQTSDQLESLCLCKIGHIACWESYLHALQDLIFNGRVIKKRFVFSISI